MFHVVLCLLLDLKEDEEGGFSWGGVWSLSLLLLWIFCGSPRNICWPGRPLFPALAHSLSLFFSFCPFKKERHFTHTRMSFLSEPWYDPCRMRLETSLCSSCPASLAVFGVMPASLWDRPSSCPQLVCCHIFFLLHVAFTPNRARKLILFHAGSTAMKYVVINAWD